MICPHDLDRVEEAMRRVAAEGSLGAALAHHLRAGGKRLRAVLALRAGEGLGLPPSEGVAWATACELLHNATLIHDDLCDRDATRRGQASVWAGWGDTVAVCLGDLLLAEAIAALDDIPRAEPRRALRRMLFDTVRDLTRGQALESEAAARGVPGVEACRRVAEAKTVPLVTLPLAGVLELGTVGGERRAWALHAAALLGRAYQMLDDLEDLLGPGQDLIRRVPNHGVARFAEGMEAERRSALERDWQDGLPPQRAAGWLAAIRESSAVADGLADAENLLRLAAAALGHAPAAVEPAVRLLAGHLERQAADLRRRARETGCAGIAVAA